jgi:3',5'-cyclic AMP phosphodiesterase CpdA
MKKQVFYHILVLLVLISINAQSQSKEKFRFIFMTDIHITDQPNAIEGFNKAIDECNSLNPDFVITGGDLVMDVLNVGYNRADSLYKLYLNMTKRFKNPLYNCMGNHEIWAWAIKPTPDTTHYEYGKGMYEKRIKPSYYSFDVNGWHFIILSSIQRDYNGVYKGGIDEKQIDWLKMDISKTDKKTPTIIITHIPLLTLQSQYFYGSLAVNSPGDVIVNSKEVLNLFKDYNLKLVLQGHLHSYEKLEINNITFITGGAVCASWWNGPYHSTEEGFVVVDIEDNKLKADYHDYGWNPAIKK